jgi:hypothetical protein
MLLPDERVGRNGEQIAFIFWLKGTQFDEFTH